MKKLFSLLFVALLSMTAWGATVTFVAGTDVGTNGTSGNPDSMTKDGVTISGTDAAFTTAEYRFYAGSTTTISSTAGNITAIEFTCTASGTTKYGPGCWNTQTPTYTYEDKIGTWTGNATTMDFVATAQVRATQIVVTIDDSVTPPEPTLAAPAFNPADGYHFTGSLAVTVSCETENASIYVYEVVDGEIDYNSLQYFFESGEFYVTETKTFAAQSFKGDESSDFVYATYTLDGDNPDPPVYNYIKFNHADDAETSRGEYTIERNGCSFTVSDGLVGSESYRIYKNATITFVSTVGNITKIEFDGVNSANAISKFGEVAGMTYDGNNGVWEGTPAETLTFTATEAQVRAGEIRVYVEGEAPITVLAPTFTPGTGYTFTESLDVTIGCATEGATIHYMVNDDDEMTGAAPVTVTLYDSATITAYASVGDVESDIVEATYTKEEGPAGEPIVFDSETDQGDGNQETNPWTVVKDGITMACSSGRVYNEGYRIYQGSTLTFTSTVGNILRIEFDGVETYPVSRLTPNCGNMAASGVDGVWTGKSTVVVFTASQQARATEIRVYVDGDSTAQPPIEVAVPVFIPGHNTTFIGSQEVAITCETPGSVIYYSIDEKETWNLYSAPFPLTETTTVYAYAQVDTTKSATVFAKYYKALPVNNIEEALALDWNTDFAYMGEAIVTYQWTANNGDVNTWIKDATGYGLIYGQGVPEMTTGTVIADGWTAYLKNYYNVPEFASPKNVVPTEDVVTVEPEEMTTVTTEDVNMYIIMKNQALTLDENDNTGLTWLNVDELKFYNKFGVELNIEEGKNYDVVGVVTIFNNAPEVYIISATEAAPAGLRGDVNKDGEIDIADVTALIAHVLSKDYTESDTFSPGNADVNFDTVIDIADVTVLINRVLSKSW